VARAGSTGPAGAASCRFQPLRWLLLVLLVAGWLLLLTAVQVLLLLTAAVPTPTPPADLLEVAQSLLLCLDQPRQLLELTTHTADLSIQALLPHNNTATQQQDKRSVCEYIPAVMPPHTQGPTLGAPRPAAVAACVVSCAGCGHLLSKDCVARTCWCAGASCRCGSCCTLSRSAS
jgi:hypothetical protein